MSEPAKSIAKHASRQWQYLASVQGFFQTLVDTVLLAERALLYTLSFKFNVTHPYSFLLSIISKHRLNAPLLGEKAKEVPQVAWNIVNDSWRTTLCLQV